METIRLFSRFLLLSVFISILLIFAPSPALAGGGPEPGAGCSAPVRLGYVPPPFIGDVTLTYVENDAQINANGVILQAGNPDCTLTITANPYRSDITRDEWNNLKPPNLRQQCLDEQFQFTVGEFCETEYSQLTFYESVGAGNIRDDNPDTKIVRFVVMGLE
jgi:hypothetical protein